MSKNNDTSVIRRRALQVFKLGYTLVDIYSDSSGASGLFLSSKQEKLQMVYLNSNHRSESFWESLESHFDISVVYPEDVWCSWFRPEGRNPTYLFHPDPLYESVVEKLMEIDMNSRKESLHRDLDFVLSVGSLLYPKSFNVLEAIALRFLMKKTNLSIVELNNFIPRTIAVYDQISIDTPTKKLVKALESLETRKTEVSDSWQCFLVANYIEKERKGLSDPEFLAMLEELEMLCNLTYMEYSLIRNKILPLIYW